MIKSEKGYVEIDGDSTVVASELACAIKGTLEVLTREEGEEEAKMLVADAIHMGLMTEEEMQEEFARNLKEFERGLTDTLAQAMLQD